MLYLLAGLYGLMIGNYLTSAYFRIPNSIPLNGFKRGKLPHCSVCKHKLKFYEYLPLLNWIFTRFKCNYCHAPIDPIYMFLEISMTSASLILYEVLAMTPEYALSVLLAGAVLLNVVILIKYKKLYIKSVLFVAVTLFMFLSSIPEVVPIY
jgi:leader peptidase (prepilin peptidase)/N-methyltransferase